jgi:hypothetical protein
MPQRAEKPVSYALKTWLIMGLLKSGECSEMDWGKMVTALGTCFLHPFRNTKGSFIIRP